jgi:hypothetical protein
MTKSSMERVKARRPPATIPGNQERNEHPPRDGPPVRAEILGGLDDGKVEILEPSQDDHGHIADTEGDVGEKDREEAEVHPEGDEKEEQADAHEDLRHDQGGEDHGVVGLLKARGKAVQGEGRRRPDQDGDEGGPEGDDEAVFQGVPDLPLVEEPEIPLEGPPLPGASEPGGVEGIDDEHHDGQVGEDQHGDRRDKGDPAPLHSPPPP